MIIIIISFTKRLLIKLGQRFILSDKPLDKLYVAASLFFCSESRSVTCVRQYHPAICCSSQLHPPLQLLNANEICKSSPYFPSPTWLWKSSPIATICFGIHCIDPSVCFENAFHTGSKYDVTVRTASLSFPRDKFLFVVALFLSAAQRSCQMRRVWNYSSYHGLCPAVEQVGTSTWHFHRPLSLSMDLVWRQLPKQLRLNNFFPERLDCWSLSYKSGRCTGY
jgi:hypothetical protein